MKTTCIVSILISVLAVSVFVVLHRRPEPKSVPQPTVHPMLEGEPVMVQDITPPVVQKTNEAVAVQQQPVQSVEERGDAMLFEIDAMQNTPFDQSITMPFD